MPDSQISDAPDTPTTVAVSDERPDAGTALARQEDMEMSAPIRSIDDDSESEPDSQSEDDGPEVEINLRELSAHPPAPEPQASVAPVAATAAVTATYTSQDSLYIPRPTPPPQRPPEPESSLVPDPRVPQYMWRKPAQLSGSVPALNKGTIGTAASTPQLTTPFVPPMPPISMALPASISAEAPPVIAAPPTAAPATVVPRSSTRLTPPAQAAAPAASAPATPARRIQPVITPLPQNPKPTISAIDSVARAMADMSITRPGGSLQASAAGIPAGFVHTTPATVPHRVYSHNTRAVWHARSAGRMQTVLAVTAAVAILVAIAGYWVTSGSPTAVEDLPLYKSLLQ